MNKKILNTTSICLSLISFSIVSTLPLFTSSPSAAAAKKTPEQKLKAWKARQDAEFQKWKVTVDKFKKAFDSGDIKTLEKMKKELNLANINDMGEAFRKYGATMDKWPQLIKDAKKNGKK